MISNSFFVGGACLIVGLTNVLLNILIRKAATQNGNLLEKFASFDFLIAFGVGTLSLSAIFLLYSTNIELGRAILLMGAASIVGGSVIGVLFFGTSLTAIEIGILLLISLFYISKMALG